MISLQALSCMWRGWGALSAHLRWDLQCTAQTETMLWPDCGLQRKSCLKSSSMTFPILTCRQAKVTHRTQDCLSGLSRISICICSIAPHIPAGRSVCYDEYVFGYYLGSGARQALFRAPGFSQLAFVWSGISHFHVCYLRLMFSWFRKIAGVSC